jgi:hypothetical protein
MSGSSATGWEWKYGFTKPRRPFYLVQIPYGVRAVANKKHNFYGHRQTQIQQYVGPLTHNIIIEKGASLFSGIKNFLVVTLCSADLLLFKYSVTTWQSQFLCQSPKYLGTTTPYSSTLARAEF